MAFKVELDGLIGEVKRGLEIGYSDNYKRAYVACNKCGKPRWVRIVKGMLTNPRCHHCAVRETKHRGKNHYNWNGGKYKNSYGYILVTILPNSLYYPMAKRPNGHRLSYILEHRLIMAQSLRRCLHPWEHIHHKNGYRDDNRLENLELVQNGQHISEHHKGYKDGYKKGFIDGKDSQIKILKTYIKELEARLCLGPEDNTAMRY